MPLALHILVLSLALILPLQSADIIQTSGHLKISGDTWTLPTTTYLGKEATAQIRGEETTPSGHPLETGITLRSQATRTPGGHITYTATITLKDAMKQTHGPADTTGHITQQYTLTGTTQSGQTIKVQYGKHTTIELTLTLKTREEHFR